MGLALFVGAVLIYLVARGGGAAGTDWRRIGWLLFALAASLGGLTLAIFRRSPIGLMLALVGLFMLGIETRRRRARPGPAPAARAAGLSREEAAAILSVEPDASPRDINAAHRRLMMRVHPDQGGSDWLAGRINAARDRLLRRD